MFYIVQSINAHFSPLALIDQISLTLLEISIYIFVREEFKSYSLHFTQGALPDVFKNCLIPGIKPRSPLEEVGSISTNPLSYLLSPAPYF